MSIDVEVEPRLLEISDTEILLNFSRVMSSIYPHMRAVYAHCYDPYDDVVEPLFHAMVHCTFSGKYGVPVPRAMCHTYDSLPGAIAGLHHVRVLPKEMPLRGLRVGDQVDLAESDIRGCTLVFKSFGDETHNLTGGEDENDSYDVTFDLAELCLVGTGPAASSHDAVSIWVPKNTVIYEFVPAVVTAGEGGWREESLGQGKRPWWKFW